MAARAVSSVGTIGAYKLDALDKRRGSSTLSRFGGINADTDPGNIRCPVLVEVAFERSVEVEFRDYRLIGLGFCSSKRSGRWHGSSDLYMESRFVHPDTEREQ